MDAMNLEEHHEVEIYPHTSTSSSSPLGATSFPLPLVFLLKGHFFFEVSLASFAAGDLRASCSATTLLFMRSITFFITLACLHGWTEAACKEVEWMNGSMVTVLCAWSAEISWKI